MANLFLTFYENHAEQLTDVERDICGYIEKNKDENYDDVMAEENRWKVFFHLSEMRTSVLNWYEFGKDACVLEIGGEFGALTGMLCSHAGRVVMTEPSLKKAEAAAQRYQKRENLDIYAGDVRQMRLDEQFDYVIVTGAACRGNETETPGQQLQNYIGMAAGLLKNSGKLLIAVDNPKGSKYQCGYPKPQKGEEHENGCEAMAEKRELREWSHDAGFGKIQFYYPLPDYRLAQEIYSDKKVPKGSTRDRVLNYYVIPGVLDMTENEFMEQRENSDFREICNSYLAECTRDGALSDVDYAALSTDRGKYHGFATVIRGSRVCKRPLYEEGRKSLLECYTNIRAIQSRGVGTVEHQIKGNDLIMPYVNGKKLVDYLYDTAVSDDKKFVAAIDKLRECIVKSTENDRAGEDVILKNGYIDMIPLNCFFIEEDYVFFDQEFCVQNCPLDYVLFRALRYTYLTYPGLEDYVSLERMQERYGLKDNWKKYLEMEDEFIRENRRHRVNHSFYDWLRNGNAAQAAVFDGLCELYVSAGFDVREKDSQNIWYWVTQKESVLYLKNRGGKNEKIKLCFMIGPAPGREKLHLVMQEENGDRHEILEPQMVEYRADLPSKGKLYLRFLSEDEPVRLENGDPRSFAFQFLNPLLVRE